MARIILLKLLTEGTTSGLLKDSFMGMGMVWKMLLLLPCSSKVSMFSTTLKTDDDKGHWSTWAVTGSWSVNVLKQRNCVVLWHENLGTVRKERSALWMTIDTLIDTRA